MVCVPLLLSLGGPARAEPDPTSLPPAPAVETPAPAAPSALPAAPAPVPPSALTAAPAPSAAVAPAPVVEPPPPPVAKPPAPPRLVTSNTVEIADAPGDAVAMGNTVRITQEVGDNAVLLGRTVTVRAPVHGDVLAMGQIIKVDAPIDGDLYTMAAEVQVTERGSVGGNVFATSQRLVIHGPVQGDITLRSEQLDLDAPVHGSASLVFGQLELGNRTAIDGNLRYISPNPLPALVSTVRGISSYSLSEEVDAPQVRGPLHFAALALEAFLGALGSYLAQLLVGTGMLLLLGEFARRPAKTIAEQPLISFILGAAAMIAIPVLTILVGFLFARLGFIEWLASLITSATPTLAAAAATVWGFGFIVGRILTALMIGERILRRFSPARADNSTAALAAGLVPLVLLSAVPWLDVAVWGVATALGLGGTWLYLRVASKAPPLT